MSANYWLTILPETSKLVPGIRAATAGLKAEVEITPKVAGTRGADRAGRQLGEQVGRGAEEGVQKADPGRELLSRIRRSAAEGESVGSSIGQRVAKGLEGALSVAGGIGLAKVGSKIGGIFSSTLGAGMRRLTQIDDAQFQLQALGHSADGVKNIMDSALESVKGTAYGLGEAATTAASAVAAGIEPGQELTKYLTTTADAAAMAKMSMSEMGSIMNKVQTSGKAFTLELRQLSDRGIPIFTWLQEEFGVTGEELSKMVSDGKVDAETFRRVIEENIGGAAKGMGGSFTGMMSNVQAALGRLGAEIQKPVFEAAMPLAGAFITVIDQITDVIKVPMGVISELATQWATSLAERMTSFIEEGGMDRIAAFFSTIADAIRSFIAEGPSGALEGVVQAFRDIGPALSNAGSSLRIIGSTLAEIGPEVLSAVLIPALKLLAGVLKFVADNASWAVPALVGLKVAMVAHTAAVTAATIATQGFGLVSGAIKAVTTAWKLLSLAFATSPIGLIITGLVALGAALWAFFTKTETGRKIWDTVWNGIKAVAGAVWDWLKSAWDSVWNTMRPVFEAIATVAKTAFEAMANAIRGVWQTIKPAVAAIANLGLAVKRLQFNIAIAAVRLLGQAISWLWQNVAVPAFQTIGSAASTMWAGVKVVWEGFTTAVELVGDKVSWLWQTIAVPAFDAIKGAISTMWQAAQPIWDLLTDAFERVGRGLGAMRDVFVEVFNKVKEVVLNAWDSIKDVFNTIGDGIGRITGMVNTAADWVGNIGRGGGSQGYSSGGYVRGPGTATSDSILARLSDGEFVVNAAATRRYLALLHAINDGARPEEILNALPRFNQGGLVSVRELIRFASGVHNQPYVWGGIKWGDCSGAVSALANYATGRDPFGSRFSTATMSQELAARGFKPGLGPPGSLRIGWYNGGPAGGHTSATLPDGTAFEMGGKAGKGQFGGMAVGAEHPQYTHHAHLPPEWFDGLDAGSPTFGGRDGALSIGRGTSASGGGVGGGGGTYRPATEQELSKSADRVWTARDRARQADQAVDDRQYALEKAERRLAELEAEGKDTRDAQRKVEVARRELADAKERQARAHNKAAEAIEADEELRTMGKLESKSGRSSSADGGISGKDFGRLFVEGVLESIGLDGSLFSNPFEWPTVKSALAGVNFLGGLLSGRDAEAGEAMPGGFVDGAADAVGLGGMLNALPLPHVEDWKSGSPALSPAEFNPATIGGGEVASAAPVNAMSAFLPDASQHLARDRQGGQSGGGGDINFHGNVGMDPQRLRTEMRAELNSRTRTTVRPGP